LWEVPDDPRGSLRWSLSKLRRLVDDDTRQRVIADRSSVRFDASDVGIDVAELRDLVDNGLAHATVEELEAAAERFRGNFLEGLQFGNFPDFDAWCTGERERAVRAQFRLMSALVARLAREPERSLPYAHELVRLAPYDEGARATLIRLLVALGRTDQAEQQYRTGAKLLKEAGAAPTGELSRALRGEPGARRGAVEPEPSGARTASVATFRSTFAPSLSTPSARVPSTPSARVQSMPSADAAESALIGRDAELERIASTFARAVDERRGRLVLVCGEPGIGKSRLLEAAAALARDAGAFMLEACAFESESIRPFALWIDALRRAVAAGTADIFGNVLADVDQANRDRLFSALGELVTERARVQPVAVLFDDLHWSDE